MSQAVVNIVMNPRVLYKTGTVAKLMLAFWEGLFSPNIVYYSL